ncbi:Major facilitator superfamily domain, general substrate transporter and Acetyl-coenzyme A transporter 1 family-containing protein [Strongyloides ratti]|uniref:Major facilitator superfamily domain, general substrate transporter and Acetyl-coenzyme A transporter 1 family-containing protein n=1 Tax=Strongyloides ratti TaxID=34506 RepID=A0A090L7J6_STRRB|nr:Major facilitator superfamily domain, general substrate transporter and Acetyl-coenzyme A transporter 1 family-containing protein [Strongyloides ratti]CEF65746.1 Major facilitator superfamily domain, general substrate transporter and Acetyl-coenzyme A transporter 1 family-containing protein [Strongyloides ratti]
MSNELNHRTGVFINDINLKEKICDEDDNNINKKKKIWYKNWIEQYHGDESSIALLLILYFLQGIPLGIIGCIPFILSERNISLTDLSFFSFCSYPFSAKLLWAPIVDSIWIKSIGRRKTWLIPTQLLISLYLVILSIFIDDIIPEEYTHGISVNIKVLTAIFLPLNFLAATQDIAVDGWALTMLSRKNVGLASTCNAIGQYLGVFFGYNMFMFLSSEKYANKFFRDTPSHGGLVPFSSFLSFWGFIFGLVTILVLIFKKEVDNSIEEKKNDEKNEDEENELELGIGETYITLWKIITLKPMWILLLILFTNKFSFAASDNTTAIRLIESGMPKEDLAMMNVFLYPLQIFFPILIGKYIVGKNPLNLFIHAYPLRMFMNIVYSFFLYISSTVIQNGEYPYYVYIMWLVGMLINDSLQITMFLSIMAFFAKISDPKIGGTYMTLLNTITNLGGTMSGTIILIIIDMLTVQNCIDKDSGVTLGECKTSKAHQICVDNGNTCSFIIDGYYLSVALGCIFGVIWLIVLWKPIQNLQKIPRDEWLIFKKKKE